MARLKLSLKPKHPHPYTAPPTHTKHDAHLAVLFRKRQRAAPELTPTNRYVVRGHTQPQLILRQPPCVIDTREQRACAPQLRVTHKVQLLPLRPHPLKLCCPVHRQPRLTQASRLSSTCAAPIAVSTPNLRMMLSKKAPLQLQWRPPSTLSFPYPAACSRW
eukprot:976280-Pelagomonas_calceolata.AAC.4